MILFLIKGLAASEWVSSRIHPEILMQAEGARIVGTLNASY